MVSGVPCLPDSSLISSGVFADVVRRQTHTLVEGFLAVGDDPVGDVVLGKELAVHALKKAIRSSAAFNCGLSREEAEPHSP